MVFVGFVFACCNCLFISYLGFIFWKLFIRFVFGSIILGLIQVFLNVHGLFAEGIKTLQIFNQASWHETFLALWLSALRLVQRVETGPYLIFCFHGSINQIINISPSWYIVGARSSWRSNSPSWSPFMHAFVYCPFGNCECSKGWHWT